MTRRLPAVSVGLVSLLVIAGCAPEPQTDWTPPAWSSPLRVIEARAPIDPADIPGLTPQRLRNEDVGVHARMAYLPGTGERVAAFNARIDGVVRAAIAQRSAAGGVTYRPAVEARGAGLAARGCVPGSTLLPASEVLADPALGGLPGPGVAIVCDIVAAQGSILGERIRIVTGSATQVDSDRSVVVYVDAASGEVVTAAELWGREAVAALRDDLAEAVRRDAGALSLDPSGPLDAEIDALVREGLAVTVPAEGGAFAVTLPAGFLAAELGALGLPLREEPFVVEVPVEVVARLATPFGQRLSSASGVAFDAPPAVPAGLEWIDCALLPCVALTYDDGPSRHTPRLLDELRDARATATFYVLGQYASNRPAIIQRMADEGHEIGGHTWNHPALPKLTAAGIRSQLNRTHALLQKLTGKPVTSFRPPYGEYNTRVLAAAGMPVILWSVDTRDWAGPSEPVLLRRAIDGPRPGGIVLFHDTSAKTVRLAPEIIVALRDRGFTLVTVTQLFGGELPERGAWRSAP